MLVVFVAFLWFTYCNDRAYDIRMKWLEGSKVEGE